MNVVPVYDFHIETKTFVERGLWAGKRQFGECIAIGFATENVGLIAGVVYHNYDEEARSVEISAYSSSRAWCSKERLRTIYNYPFQELNVRLIVARHSAFNQRARRIWKALGAEEYTIPKLRSETEAEIIAVLHNDDWLNSKYMRGVHCGKV